MSIKDKIQNAREDDWLTKDLSEEELNNIKEAVNREKAIEVLQSHKSHWERLLRDKICDKTEGTDFINAVDMAIKALQDIDFLTFLMNNINKNELEAYFSMYRAINEITESEEEE